MGTKESIFSKESLLPQEEVLEISKKQKQLTIGIPKENHDFESRISLTPLNIEVLVNNGHHVLIESGAGKYANFSDKDFSEHGALIVYQAKEVFQADILIKVSPPTEDEIEMMKERQILLSSLNVISLKKEIIYKLMQKKVTAIAFEYLRDKYNHYPVVRSMSEIVGSTSILIASEYLSNIRNGKGEMLGGITGVNPSEVVILGAGTAGECAARTAIGLGAMVKIFDTSIYKLRRVQNSVSQHVYTSVIQPQILSNALKTADVLIGAIRLINKGPRYYVTEEMVKSMKKGSVIIDISIDQGGCVETSRITSHNDPIFIEHEVVHYCVPNISSRVARTATYALSNIFTPILMKLGEAGSLKQFLKDDTGFRDGVYIYNGILTNPYVGNKLGIPSRDINLLRAAF